MLRGRNCNRIRRIYIYKYVYVYIATACMPQSNPAIAMPLSCVCECSSCKWHVGAMSPCHQVGSPPPRPSRRHASAMPLAWQSVSITLYTCQHMARAWQSHGYSLTCCCHALVMTWQTHAAPWHGHSNYMAISCHDTAMPLPCHGKHTRQRMSYGLSKGVYSLI